MPFASANGIRLYYETAGHGPAVILVSGLGAGCRRCAAPS